MDCSVDGAAFAFASRAPTIAEHLERVARQQSLPIPDGFRMLSYVQGKYVEVGGNNIRACIDQLPDALRRFNGKAKASAA